MPTPPYRPLTPLNRPRSATPPPSYRPSIPVPSRPNQPIPQRLPPLTARPTTPLSRPGTPELLSRPTTPLSRPGTPLSRPTTPEPFLPRASSFARPASPRPLPQSPLSPPVNDPPPPTRHILPTRLPPIAEGRNRSVAEGSARGWDAVRAGVGTSAVVSAFRPPPGVRPQPLQLSPPRAPISPGRLPSLAPSSPGLIIGERPPMAPPPSRSSMLRPIARPPAEREESMLLRRMRAGD